MRRRTALVPLLVLVLAACGAGDDGGPAGDAEAAPQAAASGPPSAQEFLLRGNDQDLFVPMRFTAKVGRLALTLTNGQVPHNVVFDDPTLPGIPTISGDQRKTTTLTFNKPGTYDFVCTIHPGMDGAIVVS